MTNPRCEIATCDLALVPRSSDWPAVAARRKDIAVVVGGGLEFGECKNIMVCLKNIENVDNFPSRVRTLQEAAIPINIS